MLKPNTSLQFMKLGMLSPDGACKAFDASGESLVPSCLILWEAPSAASSSYSENESKGMKAGALLCPSAGASTGCSPSRTQS